MLNIITVPDPILRQVSKPITKIDSKTLKFINDLGKLLTHKKDPPGVGISAIQVGNPVRLLMTLLPQDFSGKRKDWDPKNLQLTAHLNPTITKHSKKIILGESPKKPTMEGCLSVPHIYGPVWRYEWIEMEYQTLDIKNQLVNQNMKFTGFVARVIQHEYDHLEGVLFTDYIIGKSPAENFNSLGEVNEIFFNQDDELVPIKNPTQLITW